VVGQGNGRTLVKQYAHSSRGQRASRRVLEHGTGLLQRNTGEPLDELINVRAVFEVLEQREDRHARATEHPCSTDPIRMPLGGGAGRPIDHNANGSIVTLLQLTHNLYSSQYVGVGRGMI
jgi:hypothetical protein